MAVDHGVLCPVCKVWVPIPASNPTVAVNGVSLFVTYQLDHVCLVDHAGTGKVCSSCSLWHGWNPCEPAGRHTGATEPACQAWRAALRRPE